MKTPILALGGFSGSGLSGTAARYTPLCMGGAESAYNATITNVEVPMPIAGTFSNLYSRLPVPGASNSWETRLMLDGAASALTCTQSGTATDATPDTSNPVSATAGQKVALRTTPTVGGSAIDLTTPLADIGLLFTATTPGESAIFGSGSVSNSATNYLPFGQSRTGGATENLASVVIPTAGVLDKLYVELSGAPGTAASGKQYAFSVYINGAAVSPAITCTILDTATGASDLTHSVTVAAGDTLSLESIPTSTPTARATKFSMRWVPTISGESLMLSMGVAALSSSAARWIDVNGSALNTDTEALFQNIAPYPFEAKKLKVKFNTAPGGSASRAYVLRKNEADQSLTATVSTSATTAEDITNTVSVAAGDRIGWKTTPSTAPAAAGSYRISAVAYIASSSARMMTLLGVG